MVLALAKVREEKELFNRAYIPSVYNRHSVLPLSKLQYYSVSSLAILKLDMILLFHQLRIS